MEIMYERVAGMDVGKKEIAVTVRVPGAGVGAGRVEVTRKFKTFYPVLAVMAAWLVEQGVTHVAMESTGMYWLPVFHALCEVGTGNGDGSGGGLKILLVNAAHVKNVPGRKTDVKDSQWLAQLLEVGLLRGSFIPPQDIAAIRDVTRYRKKLIQSRTSELQRLGGVLQDAGVKIDSVASKITTMSARDMIEALIGGERDPRVLAQLARGRMRAKIPDLSMALAGRFGDHHALLARLHLDMIDHLDEMIARLNAQVEAMTVPFCPQIQALCTIPGIGERTAQVVVAAPGWGGALRRPTPFRTVRAPHSAHGSSKPLGRRGSWCWLPAFAGLQLAAAGGMYQAGSGVVRAAAPVLVNQILGGDRPADDAQPPCFPFVWRLGWLICSEQGIPAQRAATGLTGEQAQVVAVQRGFDPSSPTDPVVDQVGVIGRCRAGDHLVSDDAGPGELDQVGDAAVLVAAGTVAEHPVVVADLVEPAEVASDDPLLRLVGVAALGPPVGELPHVGVQRVEDLAGHHPSVVGRPAPDDRVERGDDRRRVRAA
jgi:transposase